MRPDTLSTALGLVLCLALAAPAVAQEPHEGAVAASTDLESLMALLGSNDGVRARFQETRTLSILSEPIVTEGLLFFAPPDRLARHSTRPTRSSVLVSGGRIYLRDDTGLQVLDLATSEVARALVGNLIVVLRGDLAAIREVHEVEFRTSEAGWEIDLVPRSRSVRSIVERIRLRGRGGMLETMETRERNGDVALIELFGVATGEDLDRVELEAMLSVEALRDPP